MSFRSRDQRLDTSDHEAQGPNRRWFVQGFVNNLLNPKGALLSRRVYDGHFPETSASVMLLLIVSMMLVSASFWLFFVYTLDRPVIREFVERSQQTVNGICGVVLLLLGVRVASMTR